MAAKPVCKYGSSCYRKNPHHLKVYSHPEAAEKLEGDNNTVNKEDSAVEKNESTSSPPCKRARRDLNDTHKEDVYSTTDIADVEPLLAANDEETEADGKGVTTTDSDGSIPVTTDIRQTIRSLFLVNMPDDFYQFWEFCVEIDSKGSSETLVDPLGLTFTGPYDVLSGRLQNKPWEKCVLHGRHFYDPPEMITVLMDDDPETGYHIGYFRDDPKSNDCLVVANTVSEGCTIKVLGANIFTAINHICQTRLKTSSTKAQKVTKTFQDKLIGKAESLGIDLKPFKTSSRKPVSKCFNQIGISVPVDKENDVGYRSLTMTNKQLKSVLDNIATHSLQSAKDSLQELYTYVQFANDECDYGMGLELGIDLFCYGNSVFHDRILHLLPLAYDLLDRQEYGKIIERHLKNRKMPKCVLELNASKTC